jgi:ABC-type glycerol-3-phosphate transport system substrate-binding protein
MSPVLRKLWIGRMVRNRSVHHSAIALVLASVLILSNSACRPTTTPQPLVSLPSNTPTTPTVDVTRSLPTPTPVPAGEPQTLTLWVTELVLPLDSEAVQRIFEQQVLAFEATHPGLTIEVLHKKPDGKGGIQDFLTTASAVAPAMVPDLIAIDTRILPEVARKGLIVPLDGLFPAQVLADLYPFAIEAGTVDDQLMGVQFEVSSVEHAIYNPSKIAQAPATWAELLSSGATYVFPAAGQNGVVNDAFLIQYLSTGARLVDANGDPALDLQALADVLAFYQRGIEEGIILPDVLQYATVENCWPKYLQAEVAMSDISSNLYLAVMASEATAIPTRDGQPTTLSRGYTWALTTRDPSRQLLAVKLLEWLMNPANIAAWSQESGHLPTRRAAFEQMERGPYLAFMYDQLEHALPYRSSETHLRIYRAMQQAIDAVLRNGVSPSVAAENVLKAIEQGTS